MFTVGPALFRQGSNTDPFFGSVRALLHLDNNLTDNSSVANVPTSSGGFAYSSTIAKFVSSGDFTAAGNNAVVTIPSSTSLSVGSGDFTVEFWWYPTVLTSGTYFLAGDGSTLDIYFYVTGVAKLGVYVLGYSDTGTGPVTLVANTWQYIALSKVSNTMRVFVNGVLNTTLTGPNNMGTSCVWTLGSWTAGAGSGTGGRCYIDDFRLTVGVGRYTTTCPVPTAAFPNS